MKENLQRAPRLVFAVPVLAFVVFLVYLLQIRTQPFVRHLVANPLVYDDQAHRILEGLPRTQAFFLSPLYPAFMALVFAVSQGSRLLLQATQGFLLAVNVGLLGAACLRILPRRVTIAAMFGMTFYWSFYYFAGEILPTTLCLTFLLAGFVLFAEERAPGLRPPAIPLLVFAGLIVLVYALPGLRHSGALLKGRSLPAPPGSYWGSLVMLLVFVPASTALLLVFRRLQRMRRYMNLLASGILMGLSILVWSGASFAAGLFALSLLWGSGGRLVRTGVFILGLGVPVAAGMSHNYLVSGDLIPVTSSFGVNLFIGNNASSEGMNPFNLGRADEVRIEADRQRLSGAERSDFFRQRAIEFMREEPARWIALGGRKALMSLSRFNVDNNADISERRDAWRLLFLPVLHFGIVFPLGIAGIRYCLRDNRRAYPLLLGFAGCMAVGVLFFVAERFRVPATAFLMPLAALGLFGLYGDVISGRWRSLSIGVMIVACGAVISNIDFLGLSDLEFPSITVNKAHVSRLSGDFVGARNLLDTAIRKEPENAGAYFQLAAMEEAEGNPAGAISYYLYSLERDPFFYAAYSRSKKILEVFRISPSYIDNYVVAILDGRPHEELRRNLVEYVTARSPAHP